MDLTSERHPDAHLVPKVYCCICGLLVDSNPSNMCPNCLRAHVDITDGIQKEYVVIYCPECERYLQPPQYWMRASLESRELLTLCLKRIKGLNINAASNADTNKPKLIDAKFMWTEPHSKRIKLRLTVQKEVFNNVAVQQSLQIEYVVAWQQCPSCMRVATGQPQWTACVQLRQKAEHKKTFLYLEQVILHKKMHENCIRIESQPDGLDFFFAHKSHALNFVEFINRAAPATRRDAVQLVSHDSKSNVAVQHFTYAIDIAPLCREDLVLLPYKDYYLRSLGGMGPLVLVHKIYSSLVFLDPKTLRASEITGSLYWKKPFGSLLTSREQLDFYVIDCELEPTTNGVYQLGLITVCLASEVGGERQWIVHSHLGGVLSPGDYAKGYLLEGHNFNNEDLDRHYYYSDGQLDDVVLVRKHFPGQRARRNRRNWRLKRLEILRSDGTDADAVGGRRKGAGGAADGPDDVAEFEDEIERDPELRKEITLYKLAEEERAARGGAGTEGATGAAAGADDEDEDDDVPEVDLAELVDELALYPDPVADEDANEEPPLDDVTEMDREFTGNKRFRME